MQRQSGAFKQTEARKSRAAKKDAAKGGEGVRKAQGEQQGRHRAVTPLSCQQRFRSQFDKTPMKLLQRTWCALKMCQWNTLTQCGAHQLGRQRDRGWAATVLLPGCNEQFPAAAARETIYPK